MPKISEHKKKYLENKDIAEKVLDISIEGHRNWIATICFYAAMHIIDMQLAKDNIHSKTHREREEQIANSSRISRKVNLEYKQLRSMSRVARYEADSIAPTIANQIIRYLHHIEDECIENK